MKGDRELAVLFLHYIILDQQGRGHSKHIHVQHVKF